MVRSGWRWFPGGTPTSWALALGLVAACGDEAVESSPDPVGDKPSFEGDYSPRAPVVRRLTAQQYRLAVADLFGPEVVPPSQLEPDTSIEGFAAVGAAIGTLSSRGAELYEQAALEVAQQTVGNEAWRAENLPCEPASVEDAACFEDALVPLARRAWRRALEADEVDRLVSVAVSSAAALEAPVDGLTYGLSFVLQSPDFLYRAESWFEDDEGQLWYTGASMAERLAFLLWNRLPDEALLEAAEQGELVTAEGVRAQAERMLGDPRARDGVLAFFDDLYDLGDARRLRKDPDVFPQISASLGAKGVEQTRRDIEHLVFERDEDYRRLFDKSWTWIDRELAALYRVPAPTMEGFGLAELDDEGARAGLLGHVSLLATHAHPTSTSVTRRGMFIRTTLLCQIIPSPPADVNTAIPEVTEELPTLRDRVARHLEDPACAGCHRLMDPIGLGLETYDGVGAERARENGVPIDASGEIDGVQFDGPAGLASALAGHRNLSPCLTEKLFTYAQGRPPEAGEEAVLDWLTRAFAWENHRVKALLVDLVSSEAFRRVAAPAQEPPSEMEG